jgi:hypothetical protein
MATESNPPQSVQPSKPAVVVHFKQTGATADQPERP